MFGAMIVSVSSWQAIQSGAFGLKVILLLCLEFEKPVKSTCTQQRSARDTLLLNVLFA